MAARGFQGAVLRGFGARDHVATVVGVSRVAPHFVRVRLSAPDLVEGLAPEPAGWLRFWFPDHTGSDREHQRAYTVVWADRDSGEFAVDVVLHEPAGPATAWVLAARPGATVAVTSFGSSRFAPPDPPPAGYLLIGDPASVPAVNGILAVLPADAAVELYLEQQHAEDELIPLAEHPGLRVHRVPRRGETSLAAAIEDRDWSDWYAWVATETGSLKHLRKLLRERFGFPKTDLHAQAYWAHGRAMGSLRRTGTPETGPVGTDTAVGGTAAGAPEPAPAGPPPDRTVPAGRWRSQAAGELFAPVKRTIVAAGALQAVITLLQLAPFVVLVDLARLLLAGAGAGGLRDIGIAFLVLLTTGTALGSALMLWLHVVDARFGADVRRRLLAKLARLPLGWFTRRGSGSVKNLVQDDTLALHSLVTHAIPDAVAAVVAPVAVLVYLFAVDWRLALVLLVPVLVYLVAFAGMMAQSGPKIAEAARWAERMTAESAAYLDGQPVIRVFGVAASSFRRALADHTAFLADWQRPFTGRKTFIDLVTRPTTFLWLIAAAGTPMVVGGALDPAALLPFLLLGTTFGARLLGIGYGLGGVRAGVSAARRIAVALGEAELVTGESAPRDAAPGTVHFDRVSFGYRPGHPVVHDVELTLRPGTVTALVGPSGSGKSTLAGLLARFHDVGSGAVRVGGRDVRSLTSDELYRQVGFVFQDAQLVRGTLRDNIALARPDATDAEVEAAARQALVHDRILRLPRGYATVVGADAPLSGGERQRVTIARALLADTPVLVLDEATAFADPESEFLVQQALSRLTRDRTVLVVAHRLHTVTDADLIVVLDRGRVVETGTHAALHAAAGRYRALWDGHRAPARVEVPR
ncbi:ATP-binding cassette domain-containing protein [Actinosynnema sp. NPDC050436]|uniref:ABC transporter ATP-binding protein/permease n=1 Tax=Actinosynnema sp. NPDC050436 TaxID=3155659 RepID=UPI0033D952E1